MEAKVYAPATCPRPGSAQTSPRFPIAFIFDPLGILSCRLRLGLPCGLYPSGFRDRILYLSLPDVPDATCLATVSL